MPCIMMQCQLSCRWIVVPAFNVQPKSGLSGDHVGHLAICVETLLHWHIFHTIHDWDYHLCWNTLCGNVTMWYPIYCWVTYLQGSLKPIGNQKLNGSKSPHTSSTHMLLGTASTQKLWGTGAVPQIVSVPQIVGDHTWGDKIPVPADTQKTHGLKGPHGSADCDRWYKIKMVTMQFGYLWLWWCHNFVFWDVSLNIIYGGKIGETGH